jgi:hypothetical protein
VIPFNHQDLRNNQGGLFVKPIIKIFPVNPEIEKIDLEAAILMDKLVTPIQVEIPLKNANIPKKI